MKGTKHGHEDTKSKTVQDWAQDFMVNSERTQDMATKHVHGGAKGEQEHDIGAKHQGKW